jgi:hypothetical protein
MKKITCFVFAIAALACATFAFAADAPADAEKIGALIKQLGDADWNKRVEATDQLKRIGKPALPQLEEAAKGKDEEIASRARFLIRHITNGPEVQPPAAGGGLGAMMGNLGGAGGGDMNAMIQQMMGGMGGGQGGNGMQLVQQLLGGMGGQGGQGGQLDIGALLQQFMGGQGGQGGNLQGIGQLLGGAGQQPAARPAVQPRALATLPPNTTITEGDKTISISHKIVIEVTETIDGKEVKRVVEAGSLKELEEKDPALAQTYKKTLPQPATAAAAPARARMGQGQGGGNQQLMQMIQQMMGGQGGGLGQGQAQGQGGGLAAMMNNPQVMQMVQQMMGGQGGGLGQGQAQGQGGGLAAMMNNPQMQQMMQQMMGGGGAAGAPEPPPAPEPPRPSIDLSESFGAKLAEAADGLRVSELKSGALAAKNGLMVGDIIAKINGTAAAKIGDAETSLGKPQKGKTITLEVIRRGETFTVTIKP